ncbi:MAG: hypothetical protein R3304_08680 [Longimicrobiales bacterium]|nr:hypothetical protein [Longimicrobiales bacterium]
MRHGVWIVGCRRPGGGGSRGDGNVDLEGGTPTGARQRVASAGPYLRRTAPSSEAPDRVRRRERADGTNGTLTLEEILSIVAEVEPEADDDACEVEGLDDDCAEIEDREDDEDDTEFAAELVALRGDILARFPAWPHEATVRVVGSFENGDGQSVSFVVYLEAGSVLPLHLVELPDRRPGHGVRARDGGGNHRDRDPRLIARWDDAVVGRHVVSRSIRSGRGIGASDGQPMAGGADPSHLATVHVEAPTSENGWIVALS